MMASGTKARLASQWDLGPTVDEGETGVGSAGDSHHLLAEGEVAGVTGEQFLAPHPGEKHFGLAGAGRR